MDSRKDTNYKETPQDQPNEHDVELFDSFKVNTMEELLVFDSKCTGAGFWP